MGLFLTKIAPALAGAYIRNLFPPRKAILQRIGEMLGGVLMVVYAGKVAGAALWAVLGWAAGFVGVNNLALLIDRRDSDLLAAFLVGLIGMTIVEGGLSFTRAWIKAKAPD